MEKPINLKFYMGCGYSMEINGKEFVDLSLEEQKQLSHYIIDQKDISQSTLQRLIEDYMETNGEMKDLGFCDECGSYNEEYTLTIK